jgi:hypothetical protein
VEAKESFQLVKEDNACFGNDYNNTVQYWIHKSFRKFYQHLHLLEDIVYVQVPMPTLSVVVMEKLAYQHLNFNVALFCMMKKHKERAIGLMKC